jgi:hypothetical protein
MDTELEKYVKTFEHNLPSEDYDRYPKKLNYVIPKNFVWRWNYFWEAKDRFVLTREQVEIIFFQCISFDNEFIKAFISELEKKFEKEKDKENKDGFELKIKILKKILEMRNLNVMTPLAER